MATNVNRTGWRKWRGAALMAASLAAAPARGQCTTIDFEDLAPGTPVTTQYPGVAFSVAPQSCLNNPVLVMRITANPTGGTSSGTRCLRIDPGCPSFSDDYLRMVFADPQSEVSFVLGDWATTYTIRSYTTTSGTGGLIGTTPVPIGGAGSVGVHRFVRVTGSGIRRIEVQAASSNFEAIDDLSFGSDATAPIAEIEVPPYEACSCGVVTIRGRACDPDGAYGFDTLEFQRVDAPVGAGWTAVGMFTSPQCTPNGLLYNWNTAPASIAHGLYYLRLTVVNACGLTSTDQTVVYVDKSFSLSAAGVRSPVAGGIYGGGVCFDGSVNDFCPGSYTVKYRPAGSGAFNPIEPLTPSYPGWVVNDPFGGVWNTRTGPTAVTDGAYDVEVRGTDGCGNSAVVTRTIIVDNTEPVAMITAPVSCTYRCGPTIAVHGTATDANFNRWTLHYTGGNAHGWVLLAEGTSPITGGLLHNWNTSGLPPCDYTLRLRVSDEAEVGCTSNANVSEYMVSLRLGAYADCNGDGLLTVADFGCFQTKFVAGCP